MDQGFMDQRFMDQGFMDQGFVDQGFMDQGFIVDQGFMDQDVDYFYDWTTNVDQFCFGEGSGYPYKRVSGELQTRCLQNYIYWFFSLQTCLAHFIGPGI